MTRPTVSDEKLRIDSPWLDEKNYVHCILYGRDVNFVRTYMCYNLCTTSIFYLHNIIMLKITILKKKRCYRLYFHLLMVICTRISLNIILYWIGKVDSLSGWMLPKLPIISKNCSNKSWKLNFVQKSQWAHMSISLRSGAMMLERLSSLKYLMYWNGKVDSL